MRKAIHLLLVITIGLYNFSPIIAAAQETATHQGPPGPAAPMQQNATQQVTNIPYYSLRDGMNSTLTLNNNTPTPTEVSVTVYTTQGKGLLLPAIWVGPSSYSDHDLNDLLRTAGDEFRSGNIEITYFGIPMGLTSKVSVASAAKRVSYESHIHSGMEFGSSKLNGIVSLQQAEAEGYLAITNAASNPVAVELAIGETTKSFSLSRRETRVVKITEELNQRPPLNALIRLQHDGKPGDIITAGFVVDLQNEYSTTIGMVDPAIMRSKKLAAAHFRFGQPDRSEGFPEGTTFSAPLLLANVGTEPLNARIATDYTIEGRANHAAAKEIALAPGEIKQIELAGEMARLGVVGSVENAGIDITYDGPAGSLLAEMTSVDQSGDYSIEVPFKDPAAMNETAGGGYPFTLEDGTNTVVHLKNTTDTQTYAHVQLRFPDGTIYNPDRVALEPHQTVAIDVRKLKESNQPDVRGEAFPANATRGQVVWVETKSNSIIGRAEQFSVQKGTSNSFSCGLPCGCPNNPYTYYMSPNSGQLLVGDSGTPFTPKITYRDCHGQYVYGPYTVTYADYYSGNSSIASVHPYSGQVTANSGGTTNIYASWWEEWQFYTDPEECPYSEFEIVEAASLQSREPKYVVNVDEDSYTETCLNGQTPAAKDREYRVYDQYGNWIQSTLKWQMFETVTSPSTCDITTESGASQNLVNFIDTIYNCTPGCTFTANQIFKVGTLNGPAPVQLQVKNCPTCAARTGGWKATATTSNVSVTNYP